MGAIRTRLGIGVERAIARSGSPTTQDFADATGISYSWLRDVLGSEAEPTWMANLRKMRRKSGLTWEEMLGR